MQSNFEGERGMSKVKPKIFIDLCAFRTSEEIKIHLNKQTEKSEYIRNLILDDIGKIRKKIRLSELSENVNKNGLAYELRILGLKSFIRDFKGNYNDFWEWYKFVNPHNYRRDKKDCILAYNRFLEETKEEKA